MYSMNATQDLTDRATAVRRVPSPRYLLADDDPDMRGWLRHALGRSGAQAEWASNGVELLGRLADDGPFDLVVTDLRMPTITGLQVLAMARTAGLRTPFLVVTAFADDAVRAAVARLGPAVIAAKPLAADRFVALARSLAGRRDGDRSQR